MMKKLLSLVVAVCMLLCGMSVPALAMANPVTSSSFADVLNTLGFALLAPEGAQNLSWSVVDGRMAQLQFVLDGDAYTLRACGADTALDVSGMYFTSGEDAAADVFSLQAAFRAQEGVGARVCWFDDADGVAFSIACDNAMIGQELLQRYARSAYSYCAKSCVVALETGLDENYIWEATGYDPAKLTVSQPVSEAGAYTFAVAGVSADVTDQLVFVHYDPAVGLDSAVQLSTYQVNVDGSGNVSMEEMAAG